MILITVYTLAFQHLYDPALLSYGCATDCTDDRSRLVAISMDGFRPHRPVHIRQAK